jgi:hypothetical protein
MTLFGKPLHELKLEDIQAFLDDADAEPLLWEAKGTELRKDGVRKEVCGFANGHQSGYLILGAEFDKSGRKWSLPGFDFPGDDPPAWVSSVVQQLQPEPLVDVQSIPVDEGHAAVVEVPPIGIPPCFHNGTVYERISGQTVPVKSPQRLSELYTRGETARASAERFALGGAVELMKDKGLDGYKDKHLRLAVAVSATGHPPDISSRLFSPTYQEDLLRIVGNRLANLNGGQAFTPEYRYGFSQSNRWVNVKDPYGFATVHYWAVRVVWNGTAIVHFTTESNFVPPDQLAQTELKNSWLAAWELVEALGGYGPTTPRSGWTAARR